MTAIAYKYYIHTSARVTGWGQVEKTYFRVSATDGVRLVEVRNINPISLDGCNLVQATQKLKAAFAHLTDAEVTHLVRYDYDYYGGSSTYSGDCVVGWSVATEDQRNMASDRSRTSKVSYIHDLEYPGY